MKKLTKKNPKYLKGLEFNIPLFSAANQDYICDEVKETTNGVNVDHKNYTLYFSWIPSTYNVPEKIEVEIYIPNNSPNTLIQLFEITDKGKRLNLTKHTWMKKDLNSLSGIRKILEQTPLKM
jgi:hypothetical protein